MSHRIRFARTPIAYAVMALASYNQVAIADPGKAVLEEILVTAQRQQTMLQETPIAVTAFTSERIDDLGIFNNADVGSVEPNTNLQQQPSSSSNMPIFDGGAASG